MHYIFPWILGFLFYALPNFFVSGPSQGFIEIDFGCVLWMRRRGKDCKGSLRWPFRCVLQGLLEDLRAFSSKVQWSHRTQSTGMNRRSSKHVVRSCPSLTLHVSQSFLRFSHNFSQLFVVICLDKLLYVTKTFEINAKEIDEINQKKWNWLSERSVRGFKDKTCCQAMDPCRWWWEAKLIAKYQKKPHTD